MPTQYYENITITEMHNTITGELVGYELTPNTGYLIHDKALDYDELDPDTLMPTGTVIKGYSRGSKAVTPNYDFVANPKEFYAVPENEIPENQIFDNGNNDHEVM